MYAAGSREWIHSRQFSSGNELCAPHYFMLSCQALPVHFRAVEKFKVFSQMSSFMAEAAQPFCSSLLYAGLDVLAVSEESLHP